jgi:hypothetical protein
MDTPKFLYLQPLTFLVITFLIVMTYKFITSNNFFFSKEKMTSTILCNIGLVFFWLVCVVAAIFPTAYASGVVFFYFFRSFTVSSEGNQIVAYVVSGFLLAVISLLIFYVGKWFASQAYKRLTR